MTGYREHIYDPNAWEPETRPMRPFNWVQWLGVALIVVASLAYFYAAGATFGWLPGLGFQPMMAALPVLLIGVALVDSRREGIDQAPELAAARHHAILITILVCAAILGAALVIEFIGAN